MRRDGGMGRVKDEEAHAARFSYVDTHGRCGSAGIRRLELNFSAFVGSLKKETAI